MGPQGGGPDGGVYVIDISDPANPEEIGFIRTHQDTLIGEGMQVVHLDTAEFTGDVLVVNHEGFGKNYKAGVSLWDVTDPLKRKKLSEHFGDFTVETSSKSSKTIRPSRPTTSIGSPLNTGRMPSSSRPSGTGVAHSVPELS